MKKYIFLSIPIMVLLAYITCYTLFLNVPITPAYGNDSSPEDTSVAAKTIEEKEEAVLGFIESRMMDSDGGIYANSNPLSRSREVFSESIGFLMNYCIIKDDKDLFDKEMKYLKEKLMNEDNYILWKRSEKEEITCNAVIDDLRIVRALLDAYDKWGEKTYYNMAGFIQEGIFKKQVEKNRLYELYDWKKNRSKKTIPLCYLDIYTVDRVSPFNKAWLGVSKAGYELISNGKVSPRGPFYYKYYDYQSKKYSYDEEYEKGKGICLTYALYTALHFAEMNGDTSLFSNWLSQEMRKGKLYAWYDPKSLRPTDGMESTAVYALAAVYAKKVGEEELYHKLVNRMTDFMVLDVKSPNYGGFGDEKTGDFFSFDNLTALWALALE